MKMTLVALCFAALGCATVPQAGSAAAQLPREPATVERVETPAGAFLVRPAVAADFKRLLAGEPTHHAYFAF
jgi:hypothetical protein